jgi:hypothetical protein
MSFKIFCLFLVASVLAIRSCDAVFWITGQTTTIVTSGVPVLVQWQRYLRHNQVPAGVTGVFCPTGDNICEFNTTQAPPYLYTTSIASSQQADGITVSNAPEGSQPQIGIYANGVALETWPLNPGSNTNIQFVISDKTFDVGTLLSVQVDGDAPTSFSFSPFMSDENLGTLYEVVDP